jgi:hypothetical protein
VSGAVAVSRARVASARGEWPRSFLPPGVGALFGQQQPAGDAEEPGPGLAELVGQVAEA